MHVQMWVSTHWLDPLAITAGRREDAERGCELIRTVHSAYPCPV